MDGPLQASKFIDGNAQEYIKYIILDPRHYSKYTLFG
jgi:hypothetical protein